MNAALGVMPPQAAVVVVAKDTDPSARAGLAEEVVTSPSMLKGTSESWASHLLLFSFYHGLKLNTENSHTSHGRHVNIFEILLKEPRFQGFRHNFYTSVYLGFKVEHHDWVVKALA